MSSSADANDRFRIRLVRPSDGTVLATALAVDGDGTSHKPSWGALAFTLPAGLRGQRVAVELVAVDGGRDATVEAAVDDVRITVGAS
jgi:hypothetical protein